MVHSGAARKGMIAREAYTKITPAHARDSSGSSG